MFTRTRSFVRLLVLVACVALMATVAVVAPGTPVAHAQYSTGHDNSTAPHNWTHSDPNTGDPPGDGKAGDGYYYLKMKAAGPTVYCELYTGGTFQMALMDAHKNVLAEITTNGLGGRVYITNGVTGNLYMCRIANIGTVPERDYAELNSGPIGNTTTSDCGGPGPVWDPNFDSLPMEPAPTPGMPVNGCNGHPGAAPYVAGDPRLSPPPAQTADLGSNAGNPTYSFTTTASCDMTAATFFGSQGSTGTLTIENSSGVTVNGKKWGAAEANPGVMNQEFVGADAGVQPAGTYKIHFAGPSNGHHIYAICQGQ